MIENLSPLVFSVWVSSIVAEYSPYLLPVS